MMFTLCKTGGDVTVETCDFNVGVPEGERNIQILHVGGYFEWYANTICVIRQAISRDTLTWKKPQNEYKVTKNSAMILADKIGDEDFMAYIDVGKHDVGGLEGTPDIATFIKDFVAVRLDKKRKIYSPYILTSSKGQYSSQTDITTYWKFIKDPWFGYVNHNCFIINDKLYDKDSIWLHPLTKMHMVQLFLRLYIEEPMIFMIPNKDEEWIRFVMNNTPDHILGNRFIGFVTSG